MEGGWWQWRESVGSGDEWREDGGSGGEWSESGGGGDEWREDGGSGGERNMGSIGNRENRGSICIVSV